jgi:hypothetical protein
MRGKWSIITFGLATMGYSVAWAQNGTIQIDTTGRQTAKWSVYEVSGGHLTSAPAVPSGPTWGDIPSITIPFTDCDGYWYAKRVFHIPISAKNLVFTITGLGVDDRAVILLNHVRITSVGTDANGEGEMQFHDPGPTKPYDFQFIAGKVSFTDSVDLKPGGNELKLVVNNTNQGIYGHIQPVTPDSPSAVGIAATITYTQ